MDKHDVGKGTPLSTQPQSMTQSKGILFKLTEKIKKKKLHDKSDLKQSKFKNRRRNQHNYQGHLYNNIFKFHVLFNKLGDFTNNFDYLKEFPILNILPINSSSSVFLNSLHFETLLEISKTFCSTFSSPSLSASSSSPFQKNTTTSTSSSSTPPSPSSSCPSPTFPPSSNGCFHHFAAPISSSLTSHVSNLSSVPQLSDFRIHGGSIATYPKLCPTPTLGGGGEEEGGEEGGGGPGRGAEHIIADSWMSLSFSNRVYFGISDGIGHGYESQKSAISGLLGLLSHLVFSHFFENDGNGGVEGSGKEGEKEAGGKSNVFLKGYGGLLLNNQEGEGGQEGEERISLFERQKRFNILQALKSLVESFQVAQTLIINTTNEMTALTAGMLVEIAATSPSSSSSSSSSLSSSSLSSSSLSSSFTSSWSQSSSPPSLFPSCHKSNWAFVGASLGDCKVYHYSRATEQVIEVTSDDPKKISLRDTGGHLGKDCHLDNLTCYFCPMDEGDFIICLTDGVHDNLDPEILRVPPSSLGIDADSWTHVPKMEAMSARRKFREIRMSQVLGLNYLNNKSPGLTSEIITERVLKYVKEATEDLRGGEEKGAVLQRDWEILDREERVKMKNEVIRTQKNAPGKYDHSTCLVIEVQKHPDAEKERK